MEYVSLRFESEMSETWIVVGLSSNHKYFLRVEFILGKGSLSNDTVLRAEKHI